MNQHVLRIDIMRLDDGRYAAEISGVGTDVPWSKPFTVGSADSINGLLRLIVDTHFAEVTKEPV